VAQVLLDLDESCATVDHSFWALAEQVSRCLAYGCVVPFEAEYTVPLIVLRFLRFRVESGAARADAELLEEG
jgi:hypothetical protein